MREGLVLTKGLRGKTRPVHTLVCHRHSSRLALLPVAAFENICAARLQVRLWETYEAVQIEARARAVVAQSVTRTRTNPTLAGTH